MKRLLILCILLIFNDIVLADIAPSPIIVKGIYTIDTCKIQLISEIVNINMTNDSARVECIFNLLNWGDSITIDVGFPEMNFQYWGIENYSIYDKRYFKIQVDDKILNESQIRVPKEMEKVYNDYMSVYYYDNIYHHKLDSIYRVNKVIIRKNGTKVYRRHADYEKTEKALDSLYNWRNSKPYFGSVLWNEFEEQMKKKNFPWYVWKVKFDKNEKKTIKVVFKLPSGYDYGPQYRYFKYLLNTGAGWYGNIEKAEVNAKLYNIDIKNVEEISPSNFKKDSINKTIAWEFENFKPTENDDIYIKYFNPEERKRFEYYIKHRGRISMRERKPGWLWYLNPIDWFMRYKKWI